MGAGIGWACRGQRRAGWVHVEGDNGAPVTPPGQMRSFVEFAKRGKLFDGSVVDCPPHGAVDPLERGYRIVSEDPQSPWGNKADTSPIICSYR
jgi:hypothetical protein